jgi:hypothetical protein
LREWLQRVFGREAILWDTLRRLIVEPAGLTCDWWEGRRARIMSPVRTLLVVLLGGAVLASLEHLVIGAAEVDVGKLLAVFTYQLSAVSLLVNLRILPSLLPRAKRRTPYEIATFTLYESAFVGLLAWTGYFALIASNLLPPEVAANLSWIAPLIIPCAAGLTIGHGILHLKTAFGLGLTGAIVRIVTLVVPICVGMLLTSFLLGTTGVERFWAPVVAAGELPTFQRVEPNLR